uniref:hypothetical protein n=1 Tax=Bacillus thuringiensis TaxID=1428 RepID=UPI00202AF34A|nr:hypothetical protein [Bacillus thuringiensis]UQM91553.1 hypothetical protein SY271_000828 [Bacillus thuringiensis]
MQKTKSESYSGPDVKKIVGDTDFKKKIDEINASGQHARVAAIRTAGFMKKVDIIIAKIAIIQLIQDIIRKRKP